MSRIPIDIGYVRSALSYCPDTGALTWIKRPAARVQIGDRAGSVRKDGYRTIILKGRAYLEHRVAWAVYYGEQPPDYIDHINGIRDDNRIGNLTKTTNAENCAKKKREVRNRSGVTGVSRRGKFWKAAIKIDGETVYLGQYTKKSRAEAIYVAARVAAGRWVNV